MEIHEAINSILHQTTVKSVVELLVESDASMRAAVRRWKANGTAENLEAALAEYRRAGREDDWVDDQYLDDLKHIKNLARKYNWNVSKTSDKTTLPMYSVPSWRNATVYLSTKDPTTPSANLPIPWPKVNNEYSVWTLHLYYPTVAYLAHGPRALQYSMPTWLAPRSFSAMQISDEVKRFLKDFQRMFPGRQNNSTFK